jgi:superfamily I DNA/RNA helicase
VLVDDLRATLAGLLPLWFASGTRTDDARVVLLDVRDAKGLEFDVVVLVEPELMIESSPRGLSDLYVALTRATQRLVMVHSKGLPEVFAPQHYEVRDLPRAN